MAQNLLLGLVAGAAGTAALNILTYLDMVIRGRPASEMPAKDAAALGNAIGIHASDQKTQNRESAYGALFGYGVGLVLGLLYGIVRPSLTLNAGTALIAGIVTGVVAMLASDIPSIALRQTNPKTWGLSGWLADIIPHLAYGIVVAFTFEAFYHA